MTETKRLTIQIVVDENGNIEQSSQFDFYKSAEGATWWDRNQCDVGTLDLTSVKDQITAIYGGQK